MKGASNKYKFPGTLLDFFFPKICLHCGMNTFKSGIPLCIECEGETEYSGKVEKKNLITEDKKETIEDYLSLFEFEKEGPVQALLHELKYNGRFSVGVTLGKSIIERHRERVTSWKVDYILPVPLHTLKKAERGYNQALFIAKGISSSLAVKARSDILKRCGITETQTHLSAEERMANVSDAFRTVKGKRVYDKTLLLVDDVITTGSTILECARVLKLAGAGKIYAASIALA